MPTVTVDAGGGGEYLTITAALAAISGATAGNIYTVLVSPGTYPELGTYGFGLALKHWCNIQGASGNPDDVVIQSTGGGTGYHGIWAVASSVVSAVTVQALAVDNYAVHVDNYSTFFTMENCKLIHDNPAKPAIGGGARANQVVTFNGVEVVQGTASVHGDVYSRGISGFPWLWDFKNCTMPSFGVIDYIEYKENIVRFTNCVIPSLQYQKDLTYYNANIGNPLFNQGRLVTGVFIVDGGGNNIDLSQFDEHIFIGWGVAPITTPGKDPFEFEPVMAHSAGADLSAAINILPNGIANRIIVQAFNKNIRFTLDGSEPTSSKGFQIKPGWPPIQIGISPYAILRVIEEEATADLQYQWGKA